MILQILNELASTSSRLEKEAIILREKDNELLKQVYFLAYDPFTQFYQRKIPKYTPNTNPVGDNLDWGMDQLVTMLASRKVTGNAAIEHLQYVLENVSDKNALVLERIIGKDLKCGASDSTANKIWPGLVHDYPCMLASGYDEKLVAKIKWPAFAQLKMDGMRFNAIVKDGKCEFRTRNGKEVNLLGNLEAEFIALAAGNNTVFDGELVVMDEEDWQYLDRQTGNGILNKAVKGTITPELANRVCATLWDIIPYEDFQNSISKHAYKHRFALLEAMHLDSGKIRIVSNRIVANLEEARTLFERYLAEGQEGIILKDSMGLWENKRSRGQIKFKGELECDLKIVGIQEGTGKYVGKIGAYICESEDGILKCDVGSGFKDDQRIIDQSVIGKVIAVKYNARIKNKQGRDSLFLPIFLEIREDKIVADNAINIQ